MASVYMVVNWKYVLEQTGAGADDKRVSKYNKLQTGVPFKKRKTTGARSSLFISQTDSCCFYVALAKKLS